MPHAAVTRAEKPALKPIPLTSLTLDQRLQPRLHKDEELVREYADAMRRGDTFPPIRVITDQDHSWLVDGWHRVTGAKRAARIELPAEISRGTFDDAEDYVLTANRTHGLRRTQADVQNAIRRALLTKRWIARSDNWIGKHIGCDHKTVTAQREQLESTGEIPKLKRLLGEDGKERRRPTPMPKPAPKPTPATKMADPQPVSRPAVVNDARRESESAQSDDAPRANATIDVLSMEPAVQPVHQQPMITTPGRDLSVHYSSESPEHLSPPHIIEAARQVLGSIDLDPCSNDYKSPNVPALQHFTKADDGLSHDWCGSVYLNPPYGREIEPWITKLVADYQRANRVTDAIALVPARTDTEWWRALRKYWCCFLKGRLTFGGNTDPAPFPSAVFYLGKRHRAFYEAFSPLGDIWQCVSAMPPRSKVTP